MRQLPEKLEALDGLRGLASLNVVLHHFLLAFAPWAFNSAWVKYLVNGPFAVEIFFVHSGFVLSYHFLKKQERKILELGMLKRYFRLTIPLAFSIFFAYVLLKLELIAAPMYGKATVNAWFGSYYGFAADFGEALKQATYATYTSFKSDTTYNPVLWTISIELIASYAVYLGLWFFGLWRFRAGIYFLALILFPVKSHAHAFLWGMILCELYVNTKWLKLKSYYAYILILLGLVLLPVTYLPLKSFAAFCLIFSLLLHELAQKFLSRPVFVWLGRFSFALYILHYPLLSSLSVHLTHYVSLSLNLVLTLVILLLLSALTYFFIDRPGIRFSTFWAMRVYKKFRGN